MSSRYNKLVEENNHNNNYPMTSIDDDNDDDNDGEELQSLSLSIDIKSDNDSDNNNDCDSDNKKTNMKSTHKSNRYRHILKLLYPERYRMAIAFVFLAAASLTQIWVPHFLGEV